MASAGSTRRRRCHHWRLALTAPRPSFHGCRCAMTMTASASRLASPPPPRRPLPLLVVSPPFSFLPLLLHSFPTVRWRASKSQQGAHRGPLLRRGGPSVGGGRHRSHWRAGPDLGIGADGTLGRADGGRVRGLTMVVSGNRCVCPPVASVSLFGSVGRGPALPAHPCGRRPAGGWPMERCWRVSGRVGQGRMRSCGW